MALVVLAQVIRRVAELQQLVEDAENYLSDADGETTETESVRSDQYGRLKHSDSLLLLTQVKKLILYYISDFLNAKIECNMTYRDRYCMCMYHKGTLGSVHRVRRCCQMAR